MLTLAAALLAPAWTIQVDPLTTALGFVHVQVERALGERASVYLGPSLRLFDAPFGDPANVRGLGAEAGFRLFLRPEAPAGWWVGARGVLAQVTPVGDGDAELGGYGSVLAGYTWIHDWLVLAGGLGAQYLHYTAGGEGIEGVLPAAHTTVGVAF
ncbi:MAG: hypothetical protein KC549_18355 [Myxococcales bacterium]|nr:hypothetical protein [Myxococcales bacterium]